MLKEDGSGINNTLSYSKKSTISDKKNTSSRFNTNLNKINNQNNLNNLNNLNKFKKRNNFSYDFSRNLNSFNQYGVIEESTQESRPSQMQSVTNTNSGNNIRNTESINNSTNPDRKRIQTENLQFSKNRNINLLDETNKKNSLKKSDKNLNFNVIKNDFSKNS